MSPAEGGALPTPSVERSGPNGIAFGIGGRRILRILPDLPANYKNGSAIVVTHGTGTGLFRELVMDPGAPVEVMLNKRQAPVPAGYVPRDGDVFVFSVPASASRSGQIAPIVQQLGIRYRDAVALRLRASGKKPTTGILTVTVNLARGEQLSALTYYLDGEVVAIQNQAPFQVKLDTRRWTNGEHVLEAKAVDMNGAILTQKKTLLFVENPPEQPAPE